MVDVLDASTGMSWISQTHIQPARHQPPLRRSVQARADGQGHRHRDAARAQRTDTPAPLSALTQELWRAAGRRGRARRERQRAGALGRAPGPHRDHAGARRAGRSDARPRHRRRWLHRPRAGPCAARRPRGRRDRPRRRRHRRRGARRRVCSPRAGSTASSISPRSSAAPPRPTSRPASASTSTRRSTCSTRCRAQARAAARSVRFVHASSIAVFGTPLPARIDDRHRREAQPQLRHAQARLPSCSSTTPAGAASIDGRVAAPVRRRRPAGAAERRALGLQQRRHPRAARRPRLRMPGRRRRDDLGDVAARRRRQPAAPRRRSTAAAIGRAVARVTAPRARALDRRDRRRARRASTPPRAARVRYRRRGRRSRRSSAAGRATARSRAPTRSAWSAKRRSTR